jgi:hypothetical protein
MGTMSAKRKSAAGLDVDRRADFDDLAELADACRAVRLGLEEGQFVRNELITKLYNLLGDGWGPVIAEVAKVDRTWPYNVSIRQDYKRAERRRKHPDQMATLVAARKAIDHLIAVAEQG